MGVGDFSREGWLPQTPPKALPRNAIAQCIPAYIRRIGERGSDAYPKRSQMSSTLEGANA
jgi:hypothetical protein